MITIDSHTPTLVPTHGKVLVDVTGTGFAPSFDLAGSIVGRVPKPPASMRVYVGSKQSPRVITVSATRLLFAVPQVAPGTQVVTVQRLDLAGAVIDSATFSLVTDRPATTTGDDSREVLTSRLVRALVVMLRDTVLAETVAMTDVDYGDADGIRIQTAKLPSLTVAGIRLSPSTHSTENEVIYTTLGDMRVELPPAPTRDIRATVLGIARGIGHMLNLQSATEIAIRNNPYLSISRDPTDPTGPTVQFELYVDRTADSAGNVSPNDSGVQQFTIPVTICAVTLDADTLGAQPAQNATKPIETIDPDLVANDP